MTTRVTDILRAPDTHANRPAATAVPAGALYECSTHNCIYRSDGTAWATWAYVAPAGGTDADVLTWDATAGKWKSAVAPTGGGGGGTGAFVGARVYSTASQSNTGGSWQIVNFGNESFDTDAFHDNATNNHRFTVPTGKAGKYRVKACISYGANGTATRQISLMKNGTTRYAPATVNAVGSYRTRVDTDDILSLVVGDYVHVEGFQDSGFSLEVGDTTTNGAVGETFFSIQYLGT